VQENVGGVGGESTSSNKS
jgi:hypothetical protein